MRLSLLLSVLITAVSCMPSSHALAQDSVGFSLSQFRIIYTGADNKGVTWSMTNNTERAYLMQSWIRPIDPTTGLPKPDMDNNVPTSRIPFLVTPPLKRVDPREDLTLRIRLTELSLPNDRESLFYLSVKGIPAVSEAENTVTGKLVVAVVNNIKLFYRPDGLPAGGVTRAATQLRFSAQGNSLVVDNPTPFYINFRTLTVAGKPISAVALRKLVPPYGQQRYDAVIGAGVQVEWQVVDEDNRATPLQHHTL